MCIYQFRHPSIASSSSSSSSTSSSTRTDWIQSISLSVLPIQARTSPSSHSIIEGYYTTIGLRSTMQEYKVTFHTHDAVFWKMYTALCLPTKRFLFVGQVVVVVVFPWFYRIYGSFWILVFFLLVPNGETRKNRSCIVLFG